MFILLKNALRLTLLLSLITGLAYPLLSTWLAQTLFPAQANGSLLTRDGHSVGSALIGQPFARQDYFWSRPSAVGYSALASGGSNLGPLNPQLTQNIEAQLQTWPQQPASLRVPVDLVTTSASGLDPHLSPAAVLFQVPRVAAARHLAPDQLNDLIRAAIERPALGFLGSPVVNVLQLNMALDRLDATPAPTETP
ncbi:potassium-transporting ATPase subunit KdpC [Pseudaeromonas sharmana]|uniref:Potassium-transporting ATPase KdpC subunit n=1 Tax=Pseudaeromonas sharmana TaxID=328412 RepID=A0ABV8CQU7_9GAMM